MGPSVQWRLGGQQLAVDLELLRFEVADIKVMIKKACADSLYYGEDVVTPAGAWSRCRDPAAFLRCDHRAVAGRAAGSGHQLSQMSKDAASVLLDAGYLLLPAAVYQDGLPDPRSDVHFDLVVLAAAGLPPPGMSGSKSERATARAELLPAFERVLELLGAAVDLDV